ncbi:hypothetical protein JHK86_045271 [Glycine max]|nr:hypothetical protein JHK86_045271 [Glycine max]
MIKVEKDLSVHMQSINSLVTRLTVQLASLEKQMQQGQKQLNIDLSENGFFCHNLQKVQKEFLEHLNEDLSSNVVLIGPSGDQWQVTILKKGNNVYTKNGWSQFLKDNSVVLDEFLLFTYHEGNRFHQFNVQIFGGNGLERLCLKEEKNKLFTMNRSLVQKVDPRYGKFILEGVRRSIVASSQ